MDTPKDSHSSVNIEQLHDSEVTQKSLDLHSPFAKLALAQFSVELAADEVFWMRADSTIIYVNKSACEKLEYTREELLGMHVWEWDPLFPEEAWPGVWQEFKEKKHFQFETQHQTKSGRIFPVEIQGHHLVHDGEEYLFAYVTDISERKEKQAELESYQNNLEQLVQERTRELELAKAKAESAVRAMEKAKDEAIHAAQIKTQFLANMSHEIRTPMNGVKGLADALLKTRLGKQQQQWVKSIKFSADSLMSIINDILDLAKIESGKLRIESIPFAMDELLNKVNHSVSHLAENKHLSLNWPADSYGQMRYLGDPFRIQQILLNFISNAIKFTAEGSVSISLRIVESKTGKDKFLFEVRDSGIGISEEAKQTLFERFSQGDESTTRKYGGTGLGLNICKQLVDLMGGDIGFNSERDQGSCFWFSLWLDQLDPDAETPVALMTTSENLADRTFSKARALIVEDNEINQEVIVFNLEDAGLAVDVAADGQQALEKLETGNYDIVFMDCHMPVLDGFAATQKIRQEQKWQNLPVVALTASAMSGEREKCLQAGMNDFIAKPFEYEDLLQVLCKFLPQLMDPEVGE